MRRLMTHFWQREFARKLSRQAGVKVAVRDLRDEAENLPQGDMPGDDRAKLFNLALARSLQASVSLLERNHGIPSTHAVYIAGAAFGASGTWLARSVIRLWLRVESDPFGGVMKRGPSLVAKAMWGNGMVVEDRLTSDGVSLCVLACPFNDYFGSVGRSDLTPILCAWDTAWQDEVNASDRPIMVDIRSTIACGGKICEFSFRKI